MDLIGVKSDFIKEHIKKIVASDDDRYKSKADIARALGVMPQYLNAVESGKRNVSDRFFKKFTTVFNINQIDLEQIVEKERVYLDEHFKSEEKLEYITPCSLCLEKDKRIQQLEHQLERYEIDIDWLRGQIKCKKETTSKRRSA